MCVSLCIQIFFQVFPEHPPIHPSIQPSIQQMDLQNIIYKIPVKSPNLSPFPAQNKRKHRVQAIDRKASRRVPEYLQQNLLWVFVEMQIPGLHPSPTESETLRVRLGIFIFNKYPKRFLH